MVVFLFFSILFCFLLNVTIKSIKYCKINMNTTILFISRLFETNISACLCYGRLLRLTKNITKLSINQHKQNHSTKKHKLHNRKLNKDIYTMELGDTNSDSTSYESVKFIRTLSITYFPKCIQLAQKMLKLNATLKHEPPSYLINCNRTNNRCQQINPCYIINFERIVNCHLR